MGLPCASSCCTPSGAATRNQLQQRLRCRKLVHPVNGQHTCGVECPSMATGVWDIWLGFQGSPPDGGLIAGTHGVIPQGISTWGKLASSAGPCAEETVAQFILAGGHVRASAGALAVHTALILAGGHVRASAGALAVHTALIPCVCVCACLSGHKLLSHHATNRDQVCFCRQVSTR